MADALQPRQLPELFPSTAPGAAPSTGSTWASTQNPLAILLIEDNPIDALLIEGLLKKRGLPFRLIRIQTPGELDAALSAGGLDVILSDYRLPAWDGLAALRRVRSSDPDLPFIFISGEVDEELFVQALREGARDFLFKDRMLRLVPILEREAEDRLARWQRQGLEAERLLLHQAIQHTTDWVLLTDLEGAIVYLNPAAEAVSGYAAAELLGRNPRLLRSGRHGADFYRDMWEQLKQGRTWRGMITNRRKDGRFWDSHVAITPVRNEQGAPTGYTCSGRIEVQEVTEGG